MEDKRFAHVATDPKFRRIPKNARKVKIDKRFQSMFNDNKFQVKYTVDKRGRPLKHTTTEDLKRYYDLNSDDESSSEESNDEDNDVKTGDLGDTQPTDKSLSSDIKKKLKNLSVDYARGESKLLSDSSSDDEESEEEVNKDDEIEHKWGELDNDADETQEATYRLAACNMDWDRIRATDLMVLFNSFLPAGGAIKSVTIYPSEFGKQRMEEEEVKGPTELIENQNEEDDTEEGAKYHMEKLRQYQLNRLKYYYAVITCDGPATANKIYTECDGMEYESSATKIDLRFIPDEMTFDDEIKEQCDKLPELNKYQPRFFTTTALQQVKVDLTWDETDPERLELAQKLTAGKIDDISEQELHNYLATSEGEESDDNELENEETGDDKTPIDKYKLLLQEIEDKEREKKENEVEMEVSWGIDLKDKTEKLVKKRMEQDEEKTPFQKYLDKRKEKRKEKRKLKKNQDESSDDDDIDMSDPYFAEEFNNPEFKNKKVKKDVVQDEDDDHELELLMLNEDDDKSHFSLKQIQKQEEEGSKKKRKRKIVEEKETDEFRVNVNDERFSALYTSHLYNIDPTDPHYKKTKAMETLIGEKINRRKDDGEKVEKVAKSGKKDAELSVLVKSVKRKTEALKKK